MGADGKVLGTLDAAYFSEKTVAVLPSYLTQQMLRFSKE